MKMKVEASDNYGGENYYEIVIKVKNPTEADLPKIRKLVQDLENVMSNYIWFEKQRKGNEKNESKTTK